MNTGSKESLTILLQPWRTRAERAEGGKSRRTGRAETRPRGVYQVLLFLSFLAGNSSPLERADGRKEEGKHGSLSCLICGSMTPSPCQPLPSPWKPSLLHRQVKESLLPTPPPPPVTPQVKSVCTRLRRDPFSSARQVKSSRFTTFHDLFKRVYFLVWCRSTALSPARLHLSIQ